MNGFCLNTLRRAWRHPRASDRQCHRYDKTRFHQYPHALVRQHLKQPMHWIALPATSHAFDLQCIATRWLHQETRQRAAPRKPDRMLKIILESTPMNAATPMQRHFAGDWMSGTSKNVSQFAN
ncbi:hypothetical protein [Dyella humicola]|uniref:hypothetical protein n=1 Tax=Dyella humicola TaxID=2992126 RepID=UPI00225BB12B|nr:hypothetical protein [Dyella humicola]